MIPLPLPRNVGFQRESENDSQFFHFEENKSGIQAFADQRHHQEWENYILVFYFEKPFVQGH